MRVPGRSWIGLGVDIQGSGVQGDPEGPNMGSRMGPEMGSQNGRYLDVFNRDEIGDFRISDYGGLRNRPIWRS